MKFVIDTNILLISLPRHSKYRAIFDALLAGKYILAISESILQEYIEIIGNKTTAQIATNIAELLIHLPNVERTQIYVNWNLITSDIDDNKFVDCAIPSNALYIITNDVHFNELKLSAFPLVNTMKADEFLTYLSQLH